jgi:hypothetical protein
MDANVSKIAFSESELPLVLGCSRRAAHRLAKRLGRRIGARLVVPRSALVEWLAQPQGNAKEDHRG